MNAVSWKPIPLLGCDYSASSLGNIRRETPKRGTNRKRHLRVTRLSSGYPYLSITRNRTRKNFFVHRLVLEAFVGPPPTPQHECNHKNGIRSDNRIENLEWVTRKQNMRHSFEILGRQTLKGSRHNKAKFSDDQIADIRQSPSSISNKELASQYGVSHSTIHRIRTYRLWKHLS